MKKTIALMIVFFLNIPLLAIDTDAFKKMFIGEWQVTVTPSRGGESWIYWVKVENDKELTVWQTNESHGRRYTISIKNDTICLNGLHYSYDPNYHKITVVSNNKFIIYFPDGKEEFVRCKIFPDN